MDFEWLMSLRLHVVFLVGEDLNPCPHKKTLSTGTGLLCSPTCANSHLVNMDIFEWLMNSAYMVFFLVGEDVLIC